MSFAQVNTRSVVGLHAPEVMVEVHLSQGLPALTIVGLPEAAVRESKDRVRSAIINSNFQFPNRRLTINLAPADLPKEGARLDLPIALGILAASDQIEPTWLHNYEFIGELALNGDLRSVSGSLAVARAVKSTQQYKKQNVDDEMLKNNQDAKNNQDTDASTSAPRKLIVPIKNSEETSRVGEILVYGASTLKQVCDHLQAESDTRLTEEQADAKALKPVVCNQQSKKTKYIVDLADVKGQHHARRALEIAAAGGHSLLLTGPPGSGKTLMAARLPTILPDLNGEEALEVASTYSVADTEYQYGTRPFREIHHTISAVALVGGGCQVQQLMSYSNNKCHNVLTVFLTYSKSCKSSIFRPSKQLGGLYA